MAWVKIDDNAPSHKKLLKVSPAARWLWVCGLAYCQRLRTDGFIPLEALDTFAMKPEKPSLLAKSLESSGLWHRAEDGWRVHDFLDWNESAEQRLEKTAEKSARQQRWRESKTRLHEVQRRDVDASTSVLRVDSVDAAPPPTPQPTPQPKREERATRKGYADPHSMRPDPNAIAEVIWGDPPKRFSLTAKWFDAVKGKTGLSYDDADVFATWLGAYVTREGGVQDGGKFFAWLDARLSEWQAAKREQRALDASVAKTKAFFAEQDKIKAEIAAERAAGRGLVFRG